VRRFMKTKLGDLDPSREPRMLGGVISGLRTQMTQRGKILIVTLDDKTAVVEVTVYSEILEQHKNIFKEDEFLAVVGKVSEDRFNGGLRITAEKVFDMALARIHYGHRLSMLLPAPVPSAKLAEVLQPHRLADGMPLAFRYQPEGVDCMIQLGEEWCVAPSDALKLSLEQVLGAKEVAVEY
jgi:DNA polymerase-3 subunit alpha